MEKMLGGLKSVTWSAFYYLCEVSAVAIRNIKSFFIQLFIVLPGVLLTTLIIFSCSFAVVGGFYFLFGLSICFFLAIRWWRWIVGAVNSFSVFVLFLVALEVDGGNQLIHRANMVFFVLSVSLSQYFIYLFDEYFDKKTEIARIIFCVIVAISILWFHIDFHIIEKVIEFFSLSFFSLVLIFLSFVKKREGDE